MQLPGRAREAAYGVHRVVSADVVRCVETVAPYAEQQGVAIERDPLLASAELPAPDRVSGWRILRPEPTLMRTAHGHGSS